MELFRVYLGMQKCRLWALYSLKGNIWVTMGSYRDA